MNFLQGDGGFFTLLDTKDVICSDSDDLTQTEQLELMAIRDRFRNRRAGLEDLTWMDPSRISCLFSHRV